jgi:uncharacterized protein
VAGLPDYQDFIHDLAQELDRVEAELAGWGASGTPCAPGCSDCCRAMTVLPLEACAILRDAGPAAESVHSDPSQDACPFLSEERRCRVYPVRPFLCRTRGVPIVYVNGDGELRSAACQKRGFPALSGLPGVRLELWNARLFRLNESFCEARGISSGRIRLCELPRHAPLFSLS